MPVPPNLGVLVRQLRELEAAECCVKLLLTFTELNYSMPLLTNAFSSVVSCACHPSLTQASAKKGKQNKGKGVGKGNNR